MPTLTNKDIAWTLKELKEKIKNSRGFKICINQNSRNFENWIQVELCGILSTADVIARNRYKIKVERTINGRRASDIVICDNDEKILCAIEIKPFPYGGEGGSSPSEVNKDIVKLKDSPYAINAQKILLCIAYQRLEKNPEKKWKTDNINDSTYEKDIKESIKKHTGAVVVPQLDSFSINRSDGNASIPVFLEFFCF